MQNAKTLLAIILLFVGFVSRSQEQAIILNYINTYRNAAITEMQRTGVPASIKLAQGIHETLAGTSDLVVKSNNHFGIKCKDTWRGESVSHDDDARGECFRKYKSPMDSYRDHSDFLRGSTRYAALFNLDPLNYSGWAHGLKKAGYATNPRYPQVIIKLIEDYHLQDYTLVALGKKQPMEEVFAKLENDKKEINPASAVVKTEEPASGPSALVTAIQYPNGEFRINDTRVIYAQKGTAFLSIAREYDISLSRLFDFNDLPEREALANDQLIYLQRKRKTGNNEFHTMKPGETLYDIAQEEAIRLESLLEYNQLQKDMQPAAGQQLYLRTKAPWRPELAKKESLENQTAQVKKEIVAASSPSPVQTKTAFAYKVKPKETIYSISKKYNVRVDDIVQWNQLTSFDLKNGQQLRIYK